jgi:uncharacterized protein YndB with AHSA1/START domain
MVPDRIEREIVIAAPLELVWEIVTEPEHVARWFSDSAEIDLRAGGKAVFSWDGHGPAYARVEKVEPPHTFAFRWIRTGAEPRAGNATLVEFMLSAEGENTRLRVVETGFRDLDWPEDEKTRYAEENTRGWALELRELEDYASTRARASGRG